MRPTSNPKRVSAEARRLGPWGTVFLLAALCGPAAAEEPLFEQEPYDRITLDEIEAKVPSHIIISPGPCTPKEAGISVEVLDLSEAFGGANRLTDGDPDVQDKLSTIKDYVPTTGIPAEALLKMAKFALVTERWMEENDLVATAGKCWT